MKTQLKQAHGLCCFAFGSLTLLGSPYCFSQGIWTEGWESSPVRVYVPVASDSPCTTIPGDRGRWCLGDTCSEDIPSPNRAEILSINGTNKLLRLTTPTNDDCGANNMFIGLIGVPGVSITPTTRLSITTTGILTNPRLWGPWRAFPTCCPPPVDCIHLRLEDAQGNWLVYIFQRPPDYVPHSTQLPLYSTSGQVVGHFGYREVFIDSHDSPGGTYVRNLYEDFRNVPLFNTNNAALGSISFQIGDVGVAMLDNLKIGTNIPVTPPTILLQPRSVTTNEGSAVKFSVTANGTAPLDYQWLKNGVAIAAPAGTSRTFDLPYVSTNDAGDYRMIVRNAGGSVTSQVATLTVLTPPVIVSPPTSQTVLAEDTVQFEVDATGTPPLSYQWRLNGAALAGETNITLHLTNVIASQAGTYSVVISNPVSFVTSANAFLTVLSLGDLIYDIVAAPTGQYRPYDGPIEGTDGGLYGTTSPYGNPPNGIVYRLNKDGAGLTVLHTFTGPFYPYGGDDDGQAPFAGVIEGSDGALYGTTQSGGAMSAGTVFKLHKNGTGYQVLHSFSTNGGDATFAKNLLLEASDGILYGVAYGGSSNAGAIFRLNKDGSGYGLLHSFTGVDGDGRSPQGKLIEGTDGALYGTTAAGGQAGRGTLFRILKNGSAYSVLHHFLGGSTDGQTPSTGVIEGSGGWLCGTTEAGGGSGYGTVFSVNKDGTGYRVVYHFRGGTSSGRLPRASLVEASDGRLLGTTDSGGQYYSGTLYGLNKDGAAFTVIHAFGYYRDFQLEGFPAGGVSQGYDGALYGTTDKMLVYRMITVGPPLLRRQPEDQTGVLGRSVSFNTSVAGYPLRFQWSFGGAPIPAATNAALLLTNLSAAQGGAYSFVASNRYGTVVSASAFLTVRAPPSITVQPMSRTNVLGTAAVLSITATGVQPLNYQWWLSNKLLRGETNATYSIPNIQPTNAGTYFVVVSDAFAAVTSAVATLTVLVPPAITRQPQGTNVNAGATVTLNVQTTGTAPLRYQWWRASIPVSGATNASLVFYNVQATSEGNYQVVITNFAGSVTSQIAVLTVNSRPVITNQPRSTTIVRGNTATLTVGVVGTLPLSYQWWFTNNLLLGRTNPTLTINNVQFTNGGGYTVVVSNRLGSVTSIVASLTVLVPPSILMHPRSTNVAAGTRVAFSVIATGIPPPYYQWQFNGANLFGAVNATLNLTNVKPAQAGNYRVLVNNGGGSLVSSNALLTVAPERILPEVTITNPPEGARLTNASTTLQGTARDNLAVTQVLYMVNSQPFRAAFGTTIWSAAIPLTVGTNVFKVYCKDASGNSSRTNSRSVFRLVTLPLTLSTNGPGTITGATNQQRLEVGRGYTLTATPKSAHVFSNWIGLSVAGPIRSTTNRYWFLMQTGMTLTAQFVTNPFIKLRGNYNGLFYEQGESNCLRLESSGFFNLALSDRGTYTASLLSAGKRLSASGALDLDGHATNNIRINPSNSLHVGWAVLRDGSDEITGHVSNGVWRARLWGDRAVFNSLTLPATNYEARYTWLIPGTGGESDAQPGGDSHGTAVIDRGGMIAVTGFLADSVPMSQKVPVSKNGDWPFYASLYNGKGVILGWMNIDTNRTDDDFHGNVSWIKEAYYTPLVYTNGLVYETNIIGTIYRPPGGITNRILSFTNGKVMLNGGYLTDVLSNGVVVAMNNRVTNLGPHTLFMTLTPSSGLFSGSLTETNSTKRIGFKGALLQKPVLGYGGGYFIDTNRSGKVIFQSAPTR